MLKLQKSHRLCRIGYSFTLTTIDLLKTFIILIFKMTIGNAFKTYLNKVIFDFGFLIFFALLIPLRFFFY